MKNFLKPNIVISNCIEHCNCRYNGSIVNDDFINKLKSHVNFNTVCPEVEIGLPIPRDALRLISDNDDEKLVFSKSGEDLTEKMNSFSNSFLEKINSIEIDGFILKSRSPSCGLKDVKIYKSHGKSPAIPKKSSGLFAKNVMNKYPHLPIEDEGRLSNYSIREHFLTKIYTNSSFRKVKKDNNIKSLIRFQSENKYLLMAYSPGYLKNLGKITANNENKDIETILNEYEIYLNKALSNPLKPSRNVNMLLHLFGYFSRYLSSKEKAFFLENLENYSNKKVPFSIPLTLLNSWVMRFENEYLSTQTIFEPFPSDLIETRDSGKIV